MQDPFVPIDVTYHQEMQQAIAAHGADPAAFETARLQVEARREASKAAVARQAFEAEIVAREANAATLRTKAATALGTNATFLAIATPTAAQNTAQAKALTRQVNAIIKLLLADLEDVNDT